ncbi:histone-lysine N-methyltransferase SETMAR-like [Tachypleus tridentatus]|uniref:histone-lysine N-methyltransferase SETMAR-like n=1 Tax=Tachypleus tridentatus TaxID=6853 RepID=UPI003FD47097
MKVSEEQIRHMIFYESRKRKSATEATLSIQEVYVNDILNMRKCQRWLNKFRSVDCNLTDVAGTGRRVEFDNDLLLAVTVKELTQKLNSSPSTVLRHLQQLGRVSKLGK